MFRRFLFLMLIAHPITSSPVPQVCHDLINGVEREYLLEDVNACYECGWHKLTELSRSSNVVTINGPEQSALNNPSGAWCSDGDVDSYLELDVGKLVKMGGFKIQGYGHSWITTFKVVYKNYDGDYVPAKDVAGNTKIFMGNNDGSSIGERKFYIPIEASAVRFQPITYQNAACLRVDLYSCSPETVGVLSDGIMNSDLNTVECKVNVLECDPPCIKYKKDCDGCETCECDEVSLGEKFEVDIVMTEQTKESVQATLLTKDYLKSEGQNAAGRSVGKWKDYKVGRYFEVPYTIASTFDNSARANIARAINSIASKTCIKLVPRKSNHRYVINFVRGSGCSSPVGKQSYGSNSVSIGFGCEHPGTIIHEILHSLGFWHEQSRPDRDSYVRIQTQNIVRGMGYNFQKQRASSIDSLGSPYDISSVMHYGSRAFSSNGYPTIVDLNGRPLQTQRSGLSKEDITQINRMYGCSGGGGGVVTTTPRPTVKPTVPPTSCNDNNRHCSYWSGIGECQKNPGYMLKYCKKSCNVCGASCIDKNVSCPAWKAYYCRPGNKYYAYMKLNCRKSCNLC